MSQKERLLDNLLFMKKLINHSNLSISSNYFPIVDWIRFFSACFVMFDHYTYNNFNIYNKFNINWVHDFWAVAYNGWFDFGYIKEFAKFGWVGVDYFFIISGLVISATVRKGLSSFLLNRFLRIFPTLWFFATLAFLCTIIFTKVSISYVLLLWVKSLLLFPFGPWLDGVYWTLIIELIFYSLVSFAWKYYYEHGLEILMYFLTALSFIGISLYFISEFLDYQYLADFLRSYSAKPLMVSTGQAFAFGMALQLLHKNGLKKSYLFSAVTSGFSTLLWIYQKSEPINHTIPAQFTLLLSLFVIMVFTAAVFLKIQYSSRFLIISKALGAATYPIYLLHNITGSLILFYLANCGINIWLSLVITFLIVIVSSFFYANTIEKIIVNFLKKFISRYLLLKSF